MKYGRVGLALLMAALVTGVFPAKALADSNARIVRLSYVDGNVQIDRRDGRGFEQAFLNMPLAPTTRVTTRDDGRAEIEFEDMSTVRLTPDTLVETQSLDLRSSGSKYTLVDLQDGTAYFNIRTLEGDDDFRVTVGRREFSLTSASRFRLRVDRAQVVLAVFKGELNVTDESGRLTVRKNETLTLDLEDPSRYYLAKGADQDRYDDWDRERDEYRDRYASEGSYNGYSSAYSYGVADLNYWGSYTYINHYGYMWRPYYYGIGWNPYSNGGWYWYPGSGWIWVSAYPWGWMPFRYGSWHFIGGHGWCWRPARQWHHWSPVVTAHNPPPGQVVPTPPPPTGRRDPVLVGRGPATILPPQDPGPGRRRDPDALGRRGGNLTGGSGSGVVGAPVAGGTPTGGSGVVATPGAGSGGTPTGGPGVSTGSGGNGRPAADSRGGRGSRPVREVDLEDAIQDARERRLGGGGQSRGVITNSGPSVSVPSGGSPTAGGSGAAAGDPSPSSGRERIPESRRMLPERTTRDSSTPASTSGSADRPPSSSGGRSSEPRGEAPRGSYMGSASSGAAASSSAGSGSAGSGSPRASSGSAGYSGGSSGSSGSPASSSGGGRSSSSGSSSGGGHSSSSGASSGGGRSAGSAASSGGGRSAGSGSAGSSGSRSSASTTPK